MSRLDRLKAIREIIKDKKIYSQEELMEELHNRDYDVTQSTVSRDVSYLHLTKVRRYGERGHYIYGDKYSVNSQISIERIRTKFKENVLVINRANNILVIKTTPGEAQGVAVIVDGMNFEEMLGTVAGDDTIICVIDNNKNAEKILKSFQEL